MQRARPHAMFGKWRNLYDIVFLHILLTHYRSCSVCVMAKWLRTEDLLQVFEETSSDEETTTNKDESDADLRVESVDVDDADHDSQSEADISEDEELSEYDERRR